MTENNTVPNLQEEELVQTDSSIQVGDIVKTDGIVAEAEIKTDPKIGFMAFLNMVPLKRHLRWKNERLFRTISSEQHTVSEWNEITKLKTVGS